MNQLFSGVAISGVAMDLSWQTVLKAELASDSFRDLQKFLAQEGIKESVFPEASEVFTAFAITPFKEVKVVILGQDPYHDHGQAHGLAFSVKNKTKHPPSLRNIFKELKSDLDLEPPVNGNLTAWAKQGVFLLNVVLTVRAHQAHSHRDQGWEIFTDAVIRKLGCGRNHLVFLLWGKSAQSKEHLIDQQKHTILKSPHPSPLSAHRGFFGSKPFSSANDALKINGQVPVDWRLD
ncbi:MAG: uracil-DNA glycosylase [Pirellulaceae bacterium]|nr:uracil-DNA glycosylase [Pirellulaceae bacterium]